MEYIDEKIIPLKMEQKELIPMSLETGYYINGILEKFIRTELFEEKLTAILPASFVDMPMQIRELKYPSSARPQRIKTNLEGNVNFAFSILDNPGSLSGKEAANNFRMVLSRTNPAMNFYEFVTEDTQEGMEVTCFDFTSFGMDDQIYHQMCLAADKGKIIQGVFCCPERSRYDWKDAAKEVFLNLELNKKAL